jgi:hypothetical protein
MVNKTLLPPSHARQIGQAISKQEFSDLARLSL